MATVYTLVDPRDGRIRYVGQTRQYLGYRLSQHIQGARHPRINRHVDFWVRSVVDAGYRPLLKIVADGIETQEKLDEAEIFWIFWLKELGCSLTNRSDGGFGGGYRDPSPETREKLARASRANWENPEYRAFHVERVRNPSDEIRQLVSATSQARWDDPVWAARQREILNTPEYREKRSAITKEIFKRRRKCAECDRVSSPQNLGRHQKFTGHVGYTDLLPELEDR